MSTEFQLRIKRVIDLLAAVLILIMLFPIFLILIISIKVDSRGPIFFKQKRPGYKEKIFEVYKFRTMKPGSQTMVVGVEVLSDDKRITNVGKYLRRLKIDELPQLINVLRGEMSLVGPRPQRMDYLELYTKEQRKRFEMLPGLTGLAQVSGNIFLTVEERSQKDINYVENFSIFLDLKILIKTVGVIIFGEEKFK